MHKLQKLTALVLAILCLQIPAASATEVNGQEMDSHNLYVEYMEFYNNQQYYIGLARDAGYTIIINVGEEYAELEEQRIKNEASVVDELVPGGITRDGNPPTNLWNVLEEGAKGFSGSATNSTLYTSYKYWGCTSYLVSIYNKSPYNTLYYQFHNTGDDKQYSLSSGTSVIKCIPLNPTTSFYLSFKHPCVVEGYVMRDI